ncbi:hypothetical protein F0562_022394 [Nyssa sinensis]|uniref:Shikimate O-hydroxycinnamoyltransferase n=1 Tax=Nyssa sinensis TaxID=561372 RepID=A0A5J5BRH9_9ASTE|nr:hypothetical protein F0562_022394 [Nyssa sinensis]
MDSCRDEYQVTVKWEEVVLAALPMLEHLLPMSNLDLLLPALDVGIFLCYKKSSQETHESSSSSSMVMVSAVKKALAETLSSFYAFAGEVVQNRRGEPELLCNNSGVDFINAYADVELKHLDLYHPDASVHGKLVPFKKQGVLSVQVTELKCGGLVIGCTFDHRVADAHSANMFLVAWAGIAQGKAPSSHVPTLKRTLLTPRRPPHYHSSIDNTYVFIKSLPPPINPEPSHDDHDHLISRIYYVQAEVIDQLQSQASSNGRRSKLVTFSAFLWKLIAEAGSDCSKKCKLGIVVDGRERLRGRGGTANLCMQNYFGNVLSIPYSEASVGELKAMPLSLVADDVHAFLEGATKEEHFLGLIDWVELHRPDKAIVKVYCKGSNDEAAVVVSSGQRFPVSRLDFGWGQPAFGSYHFPWGGQTGYVMPMPSTSRDGDWIVYMHLLKKHLDLVETEAPNVFRPLCPTYLNLIA